MRISYKIKDCFNYRYYKSIITCAFFSHNLFQLLFQNVNIDFERNFVKICRIEMRNIYFEKNFEIAWHDTFSISFTRSLLCNGNIIEAQRSQEKSRYAWHCCIIFKIGKYLTPRYITSKYWNKICQKLNMLIEISMIYIFGFYMSRYLDFRYLKMVIH